MMVQEGLLKFSLNRFKYIQLLKDNLISDLDVGEKLHATDGVQQKRILLTKFSLYWKIEQLRALTEISSKCGEAWIC